MNETAPSLRTWSESGILLNDRGRPVRPTTLTRDMVDAFENEDLHQALYVCPRRSGKSTGLAILASWQLLFREQSYTVWIAGTGDSASSIVGQKIATPLGRSIAGLDLNVSRNRIENRQIGAVLEVMAPSEIGAPGRTIDLLVLDEARHIPESVIETLMPSAMGGRIFIISSAGRPSGWLYQSVMSPGERDHVRVFRSAEEINNPEFSSEFRDEERRRLARRGAIGDALFKREWESTFVEISDNPFLNPADIARCSKKSVDDYDPALDRVTIGADLSLRRDLTSLVAVARRADGKLRVLETEILDPKEFGVDGIPLELVSRRIELMARRYSARVFVDRWQAALMVDQLRRRGVKIRAVAVTAQLNTQSFEALSEVVHEHRIEWVRQSRLEAELHALSYEETKAGHVRVVDGDKRIHRDVSWALALAVSEATKRGASFQREVYTGTDTRPSIDWTEPEELESAEELQARKLKESEVEYERSLGKLLGRGARAGAVASLR